jgi:hypothetical protein
MKEITKQDVIEAIQRYKKEYPKNDYTDPRYKKDWRKVEFPYHVVWENDVPYPVKKIYQYTAKSIPKSISTASFTIDEANVELGKFYEIKTIVPAEHFKEVLLKEIPKLVTPISINDDESDSEITRGFLEILHDLKNLSDKMNSNIDELIKLVDKNGE